MGDSQPLQSFMLPGGNYGYTGAAIDELTSFENTLAVTLFDESGSTRSFSRQMELCVKEIVKFLRICPRADNLIYAHYHFDSQIAREVHGFKPLAQCHEDDYDGCWAGGGRTTLYDSCDRVLRFMMDYAQKQAEQRYQVNSILTLLTDGMDYGSTLTVNDVQKALADVVACEDMESILTICIGINDDPSVRQELENFADAVGFSQFIPVEKADAKTLARLADFISKSVLSQSQSLGSKGPSQPLPPPSMTF